MRPAAATTPGVVLTCVGIQACAHASQQRRKLEVIWDSAPASTPASSYKGVLVLVQSQALLGLQHRFHAVASPRILNGV
jgi:hypothetical protein